MKTGLLCLIALGVSAGLAWGDDCSTNCCVPTYRTPSGTLYYQPPNPNIVCQPTTKIPPISIFRRDVQPPKFAPPEPMPTVELFRQPPPPIQLFRQPPPCVALFRQTPEPLKWSTAKPPPPITVFRAEPTPPICVPGDSVPPVTIFQKIQPGCPTWCSSGMK
jgi:hypothetical protein